MTLDFIRPRKPSENGFIEAFNDKLCDECLNANPFLSIDDAKSKIAPWRVEYNVRRPHSSFHSRSIFNGQRARTRRQLFPNSGRDLGHMQLVSDLLGELKREGVELWHDSGQLHYRAPTGLLSQQRLQAIRDRKAEILALLRAHEAEAMEPNLDGADAGTLPVVRSDTGRFLPLSYGQERFWSQYDKIRDPAIYHVYRTLRLTGPLDLSAFESSVAELVRRHDILRARFVEADSAPQIEIATSTMPDLKTTDARHYETARRDREIQELVDECISTRFSLNAGRLLRVRLIQLSAQEHVLVIAVHHIICDGWSMEIIVRDLTSLYVATASRQQCVLPSLPIQFTDFARRQRELVSPVFDELAAHWKARVSNLPDDPYWLPADPNPKRDRQLALSSFCGSVASETFAGIQKLARHERTTLFTVALTAVSILLHQWKNRERFLIAVIDAGRHDSKVHDLVGCFAQKWALCVDVRPSYTFSDLVRDLHRTHQNDLPYMHFPYPRIHDEFLAPRSHSPLLEINLNYLNVNQVPSMGFNTHVSFPVDHSRSVPATLQAQKLPWGEANPLIDGTNSKLFISFQEHPNCLKWMIQFAGDLFSDSTIELFSQRMRRLLTRVVRERTSTVSKLCNL